MFRGSPHILASAPTTWSEILIHSVLFCTYVQLSKAPDLRDSHLTEEHNGS